MCLLSRSRFTGRMYVPGDREPVTSIWPSRPTGSECLRALLVSGQSSWGCQSVRTSSSGVKDVWRTWRHPFVEAWCCRWERRLFSCEGRSVVLETAVIDWVLAELCGDLPAVSCPFHFGYRRGCCDGSSSIKLLWRQQRSGGRGHRIIVQSADFPSCASGTWQRPWLLFGEALTRLVTVLKLRWFFCVGNVGFRGCLWWMWALFFIKVYIFSILYSSAMSLWDRPRGALL